MFKKTILSFIFMFLCVFHLQECEMSSIVYALIAVSLAGTKLLQKYRSFLELKEFA